MYSSSTSYAPQVTFAKRPVKAVSIYTRMSKEKRAAPEYVPG